MTFTEIVSRVCKRLNLTSEDARIRIGEFVNERYKTVTSDLGLETSRRIEDIRAVDYSNLPDGDPLLPDFVFHNVDKVMRIETLLPTWSPLGPTPEPDLTSIRRLAELTYDEVTGRITLEDRVPRAFGVKNMGTNSVTVTFDAVPTGMAFFVRVEAYQTIDELIDDDEPNFPNDFHDLLIQGARADELMKMEKEQQSMRAEALFNQRVSALRLFIAKSAYLDQYMGKDKPYGWWGNGPYGYGPFTNE